MGGGSQPPRRTLTMSDSGPRDPAVRGPQRHNRARKRETRSSGRRPPVPGSLGRRPSFLAPGVYIAPQGELGCLARAARGQSLTGPSQDPEPLASRRSRVFSALIFQGEHQPGLSPPPASSPLMTAVHPHVFWCPSGEGDGGQSEHLPRPPSLCWPEPLSPTLIGRTLQAPQGPQSHVFTQSCKSAPRSPPPVR